MLERTQAYFMQSQKQIILMKIFQWGRRVGIHHCTLMFPVSTTLVQTCSVCLTIFILLIGLPPNFWNQRSNHIMSLFKKFCYHPTIFLFSHSVTGACHVSSVSSVHRPFSHHYGHYVSPRLPLSSGVLSSCPISHFFSVTVAGNFSSFF